MKGRWGRKGERVRRGQEIRLGDGKGYRRNSKYWTTIHPQNTPTKYRGSSAILLFFVYSGSSIYAPVYVYFHEFL